MTPTGVCEDLYTIETHEYVGTIAVNYIEVYRSSKGLTLLV
jgi:hypothetical protein